MKFEGLKCEEKKKEEEKDLEKTDLAFKHAEPGHFTAFSEQIWVVRRRLWGGRRKGGNERRAT